MKCLFEHKKYDLYPIYRFLAQSTEPVVWQQTDSAYDITNLE